MYAPEQGNQIKESVRILVSENQQTLYFGLQRCHAPQLDVLNPLQIDLFKIIQPAAGVVKLTKQQA